MDAPIRTSRLDRDPQRALVERAPREVAAVGEFYDHYLPRIYGFAIRRVQEPSMAEEVTAATFQRAVEAARNSELPAEAVGGWLYRVAANVVADHVRISQRLVSLAMTDGPAGDAFAAAIDRDELRSAMARISGQQREVLVLGFCDDLNADEAAAVLGCSRDVFVSRLHAALGALRDAAQIDVTDAA